MIYSNNRPRWWLVLSLLLFGFCLVTYADDLRIWSDKTGKFKIEAKFLGIENGKALLEKPDGTHVRIDLDKLSLADRRVAELLNKNKEKDNPFEKTTPTKPGAGRRGRLARPGTEVAPPAGAPELAEVDWASVKHLTVFGSEWKTPAVTPMEPALGWQPKPVPLPPKLEVFENVVGIAVSPKAKRAAVMTAVEHGRTEPQGRLFVCDLEAGKVVKEYSYAGKMQPLALSHDGTMLLARHEVKGGFDNEDKVELWKLGGGEVERVKHWKPAEKTTERGRNVVWAAFSQDDKSLLTSVNGGTLTWWDISGDLKPTQSLALGDGCLPAVSADGKYLAGVNRQDLVVIDAVTGETVAVKPIGHPVLHARVSFSPDGKRLACAGHQKLEVYSLVDGSHETSIEIASSGGQVPCFWTTPTGVMSGSPLSYVETSLNVNIWAYDGADKVAPLGDHALIVPRHHGQGAPVVVPIKVPHAAALQLVAQARKDPLFFILKPGTRVSVDVSAIADPAIREEAKAALVSRLEANGNPVGSGGPTLVGTLEKGKDHEVSYHSFGESPFSRGKKYTVTGWEYRLKLVGEGKTHWQTGSSNHPPPMLHLKEDETIESHLKQYSNPKANFFQHASVPKYVARVQGDRPASSHSLRTSQVTAAGIR